MPEHLTHIWRPVTGGRHAFPAAAREAAAAEKVRAFCGLEVPAAELHGRTEWDWIRESSCMECWRALAERFTNPDGR
ncbi:zinc finger protein [Saccharopolyspora rectivirgula]|jgi:hypothetical protein|uniref:zinc finger protein n=1 Tax=Saccharopolyspora rectivirgula TaxID=28042 RepID=UPI0004043ECC|nr:zinc finger protein [Saccharopolyspora rectivirgula]